MEIAVIAVFILGYAAIATENFIRLNKSATALLTGVACWVLYISMTPDKQLISARLLEHIGAISSILFFLMGAMTIVEIIDVHDGFEVISGLITVKSKKQLLWITALASFALSAVLDNLTTAIVMITLINKLVLDKRDRLLFAGIVIIAANAGGAWSPIGDVTSTMLWIGGQVTGLGIISKLFVPGIVCTVVPVALGSLQIKGAVDTPRGIQSLLTRTQRYLVLLSGFAVLLFVPVFKALTHLPPFMGMLWGLGILWIVTEILHHKKDSAWRNTYSISQALQRINMPCIIFFLGILISVASLESTGVLSRLALWLDSHVGKPDIVVMTIGLLSSIVDNVPLTAAAIGMYPMSTFPVDSHFWTLLSYGVGTGGSALVIGSAAGVAAMGIADIDFFGYLKRITPLALAGYLAGALVYFLV